jgi:hypothetical protein
LQAEENSFLTAADDNTDLGQTPMNKFGGESTFQTLLNSDGELSIGDKIFKQYENGLTIIIEDGDIQTLNSIRADINEIYNKSNVTILNPDDELAKSVRACRYNVYESKTKSYGSNRKTTGYLSYWYIFDSGWGWRYYGKVTNYVKKSGIWKKDYNNCNLNAPDVNLKKYSDCSSTSYNKNLQYPWSWTGHTTDYAIQIDDYEWSPINWTAIHNGEAKMIFNASGMPVQNVIISW